MNRRIISCVISCHNEEKNIPILLDQLKNYELLDKFEFILVNNGSTDNSWKVMSESKEKFPNIIFLNLQENLGWGNGISQGLKLTTCDYVGWIHSDLQYDMKILIKVYDLFQDPKNKKENILIKGRRKSRTLVENLFTMSMSIIASVLLTKILYDINAQPNFFSRKILNLFKNTPKDLMLDLYLYYMVSKMKNREIIRLPVVQENRIHGFSSWNKSFLSKYFLAIKMFIGIVKIRIMR